ncbi:MAG TPA: NADH:flavin oxidoreductase [Nocardioidaceae bacterium]|nr:NADH:flavin oxidoreductase [Nocardioidaceae bacterium]
MPPRDVFAPTKLGPVTMRNAVIKSATFEGAAPGGQVSDRLVAFHRAVAAGGVGATTVAYLAVSPEGRTHADQICLRNDVDAGLRRLTDAIHAEGAAAIGQIGHAGPVANGRSNGVKAVGSWRMPSPLSMQMIRTATEDDIARITEDYVAGARKAADCGFDGLEIHLGHGYLLSSFLSPNLNKRKDRRNGSIDNRSSFPREVVRRVRDAVPDIAVTAKVSMTDGVRGGLTVEDCLEFCRLLEYDGALDAIELSAGSSLMNPMYLFRGPAPVKEFAAAMPQPVRTGMRFVGKGFLKSYPYEEAFLLPHARRFREALSTPLILLGGISRRETLDLAMAEGFEFVAMARALLKEPDLVNRMQAEGANSLCSHCNKCMPTIYSGTRCVELGVTA